MPPKASGTLPAAEEEEEGGLNLEARYGYDGAWYQMAGAKVVDDAPDGRPALGVRLL